MSEQAPLTNEQREVLTAAGFVQDRDVPNMWSRKPDKGPLSPGNDWVCFGETRTESATVCLDVPAEALKALLNADALAARVAELEGALAPFAAKYPTYLGDFDDEDAEILVTVGDLRRAHRVRENYS